MGLISIFSIFLFCLFVNIILQRFLPPLAFTFYFFIKISSFYFYTQIYILLLCIVTVIVIVCHWVWTLGVWGELACHKRLLTHRPSSQGWAPGVLPCCVQLCCLCLCMYLGGGWGVEGDIWFFFLFYSLWLVCYKLLFIYLYSWSSASIYLAESLTPASYSSR